MQCKWERMPVRLRRILLMTMMRAQRPLRLTAAGFAHMDNYCFLSVSYEGRPNELGILPSLATRCLTGIV